MLSIAKKVMNPLQSISKYGVKLQLGKEQKKSLYQFQIYTSRENTWELRCVLKMDTASTSGWTSMLIFQQMKVRTLKLYNL